MKRASRQVMEPGSCPLPPRLIATGCVLTELAIPASRKTRDASESPCGMGRPTTSGTCTSEVPLHHPFGSSATPRGRAAGNPYDVPDHRRSRRAPSAGPCTAHRRGRGSRCGCRTRRRPARRADRVSLARGSLAHAGLLRHGSCAWHNAVRVLPRSARCSKMRRQRTSTTSYWALTKRLGEPVRTPGARGRARRRPRRARSGHREHPSVGRCCLLRRGDPWQEGQQLNCCSTGCPRD